MVRSPHTTLRTSHPLARSDVSRDSLAPEPARVATHAAPDIRVPAIAAEAAPTGSAALALTANRSVACTSASTFSASNAECPDAGVITSSAFGQAWCRSQAFCDRADHVVAAVHDHAGDVGDAVRVAQQLVVDFEEAAVDEVVVLDARERQRERAGPRGCWRSPRPRAGSWSRLPTRSRRCAAARRVASSSDGQAAVVGARSGRAARPAGSAAR